jgi:hypothetical protein
LTVEKIVAAAAAGRGMFGIGSSFSTVTNEAGEEWVGDNPRTIMSGKGLMSQAELRQYRFPSYKPKWGTYQANFEWRTLPPGPWPNNGHLTILFGHPAP